MSDYSQALRTLNDAVYAATRAAAAANQRADQERLARMAREIDDMVDGRASALRARRMNAELSAAERDLLHLKGMA
jgi:hypothetical protein